MSLSITTLYVICNICAALMLAGCASGAVVFAPTPPPPDSSPQRYTHPSAAFSVSVPSDWALNERYTTTLASAAFSPPGSSFPAATFAVVNLGDPVDEAGFAALLDRYQTEIRPDIAEYTEQSRTAMGDGSWRFSGRRIIAGETGQSVNTFIQRSGALIGVAEIVLPESGELQTLLTLVNSFTLNGASALEPSDLTQLAFARSTVFTILHVATWTTPTGAFFITGEVANYSDQNAVDLPVEAGLIAGDGRQIAGAVDTVIGLHLPPGGFAPFSLRFGSRPTEAVSFQLRVGSGDWQPTDVGAFVGGEALDWTDSSRFDSFGRLVISGDVTNAGAESVGTVRAVVTIFDADGLVIGAGWDDLDVAALAPGESAPFEILIAETGGDPANYIVTVAARRF
jgi:hypothetical protein